MVPLRSFISSHILIFLIMSVNCRQLYDSSSCISEEQVTGLNHLCNSGKLLCKTYIIYRAQPKFQNLTSVASLFNLDEYALLHLNHLTEANHSTTFKPGRELIIPIECSCTDQILQSTLIYNFPGSKSFAEVACEVFEGLAKAKSLKQEYRNHGGDKFRSPVIKVPISCACPDDEQKSIGMNYLLTYPIISGDHINTVAQKFGVTEESIRRANNLSLFVTIFPKTTLLIPIKNISNLTSDFDSVPLKTSPSPKPAISLDKIEQGYTNSEGRKSYIIIWAGIIGGLISIIVIFGISLSIRKRIHRMSFQPLSARSLHSSNLSSDFLNGISKLKHSLIRFSFEELRIATEGFSETSLIGKSVHRGKFGGTHLAIEGTNSEESAKTVIEILTKINHLNVVKIKGCCYGIRSYLVYEFAENGSLRRCLSSSEIARQLVWGQRLQIAFDLAVGLHYLHYCTTPGYVHLNINSRSVLITTDFRAKISGFRFAKAFKVIEGKGENNWKESVIVGRKGYLAPEYLTNGVASTKADVYAFGVILLELLSGKEAVNDEIFLKDCLGFLGDELIEGSLKCLEKFEGFVDPSLDGDYPLGDAICLALLAKGCVEDDPIHRPNMNDVLKALSRIA